MTRLLACVLVLALASPAVADIRESAARETARAEAVLRAAEQARPNAGGQGNDNPYLIPSLALLGLGTVVTLYGLVHDTGVACNSNSSLTSVSCGTTKSKATIFAGLAMVGAGGFLYARGKKRSRSPELLIGVGAIGARQRLTW